MQHKLSYLKIFAPTVLRIGLALVVIWFGTQELLQPDKWMRFIPESVVSFSHLSANALVHVNGAFEIIFGIALLLGIQTGFTAFLLMLHMFEITYVVGYGPIGMRDFGLSMALLSVAMHGVSPLSFDMWQKTKSLK